MSSSLGLYLHDHLAGAKFAVELLQDLRDQATDADIAVLSSQLLDQVEADRAVLRNLAQELGEDRSTIKEVAAWIGEKAGRFKLTLSDPLGVFEAIEMLSLGVLGKRALWNTLRVVQSQNAGLINVDLDRLISRADEQFAQLEGARLQLARTLFIAGS